MKDKKCFRAYQGEHCKYGDSCKFKHPPSSTAAPDSSGSERASASGNAGKKTPSSILTQLLDELLLKPAVPVVKVETPLEKLMAMLQPPKPAASPLAQVAMQLANAFAAPRSQWQNPIPTQYASPQVQQYAAPHVQQYAAPHVQYAAPHVQQFAAPHVPQFQRHPFVSRLPVPGAPWPLYGQ